MKKIFFIPLIIVLTFLYTSCKKDSSNQGELLIDSWSKLYVASDTSFNVNLTFNTDGTFTWEMIDVVSNHSNSGGEYTATETDFTLTVDPDCDGIGKYAYTLDGDQLTVYAKRKRPFVG
ncbi:MAG: hypothetical protein PF541_01690 [Prolixibacteraceae bacterium]|jgi:hypothetical protein|nr:hypothetical protein [Prolixibacteraceae bacterium]